MHCNCTTGVSVPNKGMLFIVGMHDYQEVWPIFLEGNHGRSRGASSPCKGRFCRLYVCVWGFRECKNTIFPFIVWCFGVKRGIFAS